MRIPVITFLLCGATFCFAAKPRLLVLTDIGGDPDDQQSMVRLMCYANEFEIEGLIASASGTPGELNQKVTKPHLIREIVEAYGKVRPNLVKHASGYPEAEELLARIKSGSPNRGLDAIGEGRDTEGSRWIVSVMERADPRPVNIAIWGGQTDLAQALWRLRKDRGAGGLNPFIAKLRVHDIADQDQIAEWLWKEFPGILYVLDAAPKGRDKREAAFRGMYLGGNESFVSRDWMNANIRENHGPLGALYPPRTWTAPNPHSAIKEGDTPSWFYFLENGLNDAAHPEWGGWGGRFTNSTATIHCDAADSVGETASARATVWRWREAFQNDFAARLDWCVAESAKKANHAPIPVLNGDGSRAILQLRAKAGETVRLLAEGSRDPDEDAFAARWFVYREAGTFRGQIAIASANTIETSFVAPPVTEPETVHVILEVRDEGSPSLFAYRRVVVTVRP